ncbi:tetraacyldisaccharide 4'-kinase [Maribacter aurantiacus]|uniref:Tetraacyldisaccharide 4'-kinase n=1 Tax=Maribacter aurantiacus TaxID=1882343 RepID=A0A5R8LWE4_9FLAO|nr:tetraacyldisaccharide 4'-kinase [Maribacter aurantiacus]TLF41563.1 tetraacyldisaccharide 4'-kinase [Maribacter aurantiacus]
MQLLRKLLFPFSFIYALVVHLRNFLYDKGVFSSQKFDVPIVCIGNLSVGGTGKTPMTEFLIELMKPHYKLAVLSRGYKRKSDGFLLADEHTTVEALGDEPYQIHQKFPGVALAVDANRREGIRLLSDAVKPQMIILDDAFQHRKVKPHFSFLLTPYGDLYTDDWYLPTGNLRDSKKAAQRADIIVVTKCPSKITKTEQGTILEKLKPHKHQVVLFSFLDYEDAFHGLSEKMEVEALQGKEITLVTGIVNPAPLVAYLKSKGLAFEHLAFKDHHFFNQKEIDLLNRKQLIITTEKDFVRLRNCVPNLYYLPVMHRFMGDGKRIIFDALTKLMKGRS